MIGGLFCLGLYFSGAVAVAGMGLSWLRDNLCMIDSPEQVWTRSGLDLTLPMKP